MSKKVKTLADYEKELERDRRFVLVGLLEDEGYSRAAIAKILRCSPAQVAAYFDADNVSWEALDPGPKARRAMRAGMI